MDPYQSDGRASPARRPASTAHGDRSQESGCAGKYRGQPDRPPARERRQEEERRQKEPDAVVSRVSGTSGSPARSGNGPGNRAAAGRGGSGRVAQTRPIAAGHQDRDGNGDPQQDPGIVPGQAVLVDLAEVDDLDVGKRARRSRAERVIVGQPRQRFAPPGRVAQPADDRRECQDRRPGLQRRPLDAPDLAPGKDRPSRRRTNQTASGNARIAPASRSRAGGRTGRSVAAGETAAARSGSAGTPAPAGAASRPS